MMIKSYLVFIIVYKMMLSLLDMIVYIVFKILFFQKDILLIVIYHKNLLINMLK